MPSVWTARCAARCSPRRRRRRRRASPRRPPHGGSQPAGPGPSRTPWRRPRTGAFPVRLAARHHRCEAVRHACRPPPPPLRPPARSLVVACRHPHYPLDGKLHELLAATGKNRQTLQQQLDSRRVVVHQLLALDRELRQHQNKNYSPARGGGLGVASSARHTPRACALSWPAARTPPCPAAHPPGLFRQHGQHEPHHQPDGDP